MSTEFKTMTRGGQTLLHALRMLLEISRVILISALVVGLLSGIMYFKHNTTANDRAHLIKWMNANMRASIYSGGQISVTTREGTFKMGLRSYLDSPERRQMIGPIIDVAWKSLNVFIFMSLSTVILFIIWFVRRGISLQKDRLLKGAYVTTPGRFAKYVRKTGHTSTLTLAGIPLYRNIECQHFLIHGSTGTGKSVVISELLDKIRLRGDKAIVYDKHGGYVERYYRDETDILLNPLDARTRAWHPWADAIDVADYDHMAAGLMPHPPGQGTDPFWINAARTIFAAAAFKMAQDPEKSVAKLLHYLFTDDLGALRTLLAGTEAASLVADKAEKTALSVKSVLATYLKMFKYLKHDDNPFSIREWVLNPEQKNWLFVSSRADKHESLKPLMSLWLDLAANALMSAGENPTRRLWLIVDELPSLQRLPYLPSFMAEGRKFGGCVVVGVQSYYQIQNIYGQNGAKEIADLCNTRVFFRAPSHESALWVSKELGDCELIETREGISYGANSIRDGVSLNQQHVTRPAVSASDINQLPDLHGYLSIPPTSLAARSTSSRMKPVWPIAKFKLIYRKRPIIAKSFVAFNTSESVAESTESVQPLEISTVTKDNPALLEISANRMQEPTASHMSESLTSTVVQDPAIEADGQSNQGVDMNVDTTSEASSNTAMVVVPQSPITRVDEAKTVKPSSLRSDIYLTDTCKCMIYASIKLFL